MPGLKTSIKIIHFIFWHCEKYIVWTHNTFSVLYIVYARAIWAHWRFPTLSLLPHRPLITSLSFLNILNLYRNPVFFLGKLGVVLVHLRNSADFQKKFWNVLLCLSLIKVDKFLTESIKKIYRLPILNKWSCIQCECWCCCNCCS